jgi:hypothetical protein
MISFMASVEAAWRRMRRCGRARILRREPNRRKPVAIFAWPDQALGMEATTRIELVYTVLQTVA